MFGLRFFSAEPEFEPLPASAGRGSAAATPAEAAAAAVLKRKLLLFTDKVLLLIVLSRVGEDCLGSICGKAKAVPFQDVDLIRGSSEVVLHAQLDFARIAWIVASGANGSKGIGSGEVETSGLT